LSTAAVAPAAASVSPTGGLAAFFGGFFRSAFGTGASDTDGEDSAWKVPDVVRAAAEPAAAAATAGPMRHTTPMEQAGDWNTNTSR